MVTKIRQQDKQDDLEHQFALLSEKIHRLRTALIIETGVAQRFELEQQIEQSEADLDRIQLKIDSITSRDASLQLGIKIYVSSTYEDLVDYRQEVFSVLHKRRYVVIAHEDDLVTSENLLKNRLNELDACQIYIGIFAWRYGHILLGQELSIIELEYRKAIESGLECFIFLLDDTVPWLRDQIESGIGGNRIEALRVELAATHFVGYFKNVEELGQLVDAAVAKWMRARLEAGIALLRFRQTQADERRRSMQNRQRVVNVRQLDMVHTFKNRTREIRLLDEYLTHRNVRLISIIGRGGMGKTALASYILANLESGVIPIPGDEKEFAVDGIVYLSTRSTGLSLERIYSDIGRMLGEPKAGALVTHWTDHALSLPAKIEQLLEYLQDGSYVVLLDNLEDELDENGEIVQEGLRLFVEHCLTHSTGLRLIITSRQHVRVPAAVLHATRIIYLHDGLPQEDAISLLRELDPEGQLGLRGGQQDDLNRAAFLTQGIPRALEIMAGILYEDPTTSLPELLSNTDLFEGQVVEQLVATSYSRLEQDARRIMEALAVIRRPIGATAINYLLYPWFPGLEIQSGLRRLVKGNFVRTNRLTNEFSLHPIDQEYAYRQIPAPSQHNRDPDIYNWRNMELRAADFYASLRKAASEWKSLVDVTPQLNEFDHRVRAEDYEGACQLIDRLDFGQLNYLEQWGYPLLISELREKLVGRLSDPNLQASNLSNLGHAYHLIEQYEEAIKTLNAGLLISREAGNRREEGVQLGHLSVTYRVLGQIEQSLEYCQQAYAVAVETNDRKWQSLWLGHLGTAYRSLGQFERSIKFHMEALAIARETEDYDKITYWLGHLGIAYRSLGKFKQAMDFLEEGLNFARKISSRRHEVMWLSNLADIYRALKEYDRTIELFNEALTIAREYRIRPGESYQLLGLGRVFLSMGKFSEARRYCEDALALNSPENTHQVTLTLGIVLLHLGDKSCSNAFESTITHCHALLKKTHGLCEERYALALALVGRAICDSQWTQTTHRAKLLSSALEEYHQALRISTASGIIGEALNNLESIRLAGIEGLDSVTELLKAA